MWSLIKNQKWIAYHQNLGVQLIGFYILLLIPFIVFLIIFNSLIHQRIYNEVQENDALLAQSIAEQIDLTVKNAINAARGVAAYPGVISADPNEMKPIFQEIYDTQPNVNLVYRLDENGIMLFHVPIGPGTTVGWDFSFRDYFKRAQHTQEPFISQGRISPTTQQAVATVVMPLWSAEGKFIGLVGENLKLESLSTLLKDIVAHQKSSQDFQVVILDSANQIIAYPDSSYFLQSVTELIPKRTLNEVLQVEHSIVLKSSKNESRFFSHVTVPDIGWQVIISRPTADTFKTLSIFQRTSFLLLGAFLLIILSFWSALEFRVIRPINQLASISEKIGERQTINQNERWQVMKYAKRDDQIGHLIRRFMQMGESIETRIKEQATLLDTSMAVLSSLDLQTVLDRILDQMGRLLDIQMYAIIQLDEKAGKFRIRASRGLSRQFVESLSILPSEPDSVTMRALRARQPVQVSDTETDPSYVNRRMHARSEKYRAILAVPLYTQHAPPTALVVFHPTPHVFVENEIQLLVNFANHAAMAIENAILFEHSDMQLQEQTLRLEALIQSLHDGLILSNLQGEIIYANRRVSTLADIPVEEMTGKAVKQILSQILLHSVDPEMTLRSIWEIYDQNAERSIDISFVENGKTLYFYLEIFNVTDYHSSLLGRGLLFHDITADKELNRVRASLVSTVSHELRTPLAAIKGYATTLLADDVQWNQSAQKEFLQIISDESDRLSEMVNNILDLSRLESGAFHLERTKCDLEDIIQQAAKINHIDDNNLCVQIEEKLPDLFADPIKLKTILRNLFENSLKYAGENVKIKVTVSKMDGNIIFRVFDNGPGIPTEESTHIFESFYRIDNSLSRTKGGAGLGLAICQGLVHAHGGRIWVDPQPKGACISFLLPIIDGEKIIKSNLQNQDEY